MAHGRVARPNRSVFDCSNQNLSELPPTANGGQITTFFASDNVLRRVPDMRDFSILETLNLANNRLSDLSPLASLESLRVLDISFNAVTSLTFCEDLVNLAVLTASHNSIASVPTRLPPFLRELNLSDNQLSDLDFLDEHEFLACKTLRFVRLNCLATNCGPHGLIFHGGVN